MAQFVSAMRQAMAYFVPDQTEPASGVPHPDGRDWANIAEARGQRPSIDPHIECITCGACYSACTMVSWDPLYLGPAALNRAATLVMDPRDSERGARLETLGGEHGCWRCHSQFTCTDVCPMQLRPTEAIGYLKRQLVAESVNEIFGTRTKIAAGAGRLPAMDQADGSVERVAQAFRPASAGPTPRAALGGMFFLVIVATVSLLAGWGYLVRVGATSHRAKDDFNLADQPRSPARLAGALIFEEQSCENCHSVLGQGGRSAPDLWKAGHKHDRAWLRRLFQDPDSVVTAGSMPPFDLEERDLAALVDYVAALDFTRRAPIRVSRAIARGGGEISRSGCLECHDEGAKGPAPRFGGIGRRHTLEWLAAYVKAPAFHEGLASGASALNATRREEIALYLSTR